MPRSFHCRHRRRRVIFFPHTVFRIDKKTSPARLAVREPDQHTSNTNIDFENSSARIDLTDCIVLQVCHSLQMIRMASSWNSDCLVESEARDIPSTYTTWPPIRDELETETSKLQDETIRECLPFLSGTASSLSSYKNHGVPNLVRNKHIQFLRRSLEAMPAAFVGFDASRPWVIYWALTALSLLGEDTERYRERYPMPRATACLTTFRHGS